MRGPAAWLAAAVAAASVAATAGAAVQAPACAGPPAAVDRPDAVSALQVHVVYAVPADGEDAFAARAPAIAADLAAVDAWWRAQDPTRTPRLDLLPVGDCGAALDLTDLRLPRSGAAYAGGGAFDPLVGDVARALHDPDKKYLVYYDGAVTDANRCGAAATNDAAGRRASYAVVLLGSACGRALGAGGEAAIVATHELLHAFGALAATGPPHACPGDRGHPCDAPLDVLAPAVGEATLLGGRSLDAGRDDYYGHAGTWWDVQDSPFLARPSEAETPPAAATGLIVRRTGGRIALNWTGPPGAVFRIYRGDELLTRTTRTSATDAAPPGVTLDYGVRAVDAAGLLGPRASLRFRVPVTARRAGAAPRPRGAARRA